MKDAEITRKARTRPDILERDSIHTEDGDNRKYLKHNLQLARLPEINKDDPKEVETRVYQYFEICLENDMKPSLAALALALGVDRRTLYNWVNGITKNDERFLTLKRAYEMLDAQMVDYMQNGKVNPVAGIFLMKNNHGYTDQQEVVVTPKNPYGETADRETLEKKYNDAIVDDTAEVVDNVPES